MRHVGVDLGARRVGLAVSDSGGLLAMPRGIVELAGDRDLDLQKLAAAIAEERPDVVVVGVPVSLDGTEREAAQAARQMVERLHQTLGVPVEAYDERLTTVVVERLRRQAPRRGRGRRRPLDAEAAAVMLQSFLDSRTAAGT